MDVKAYEMNVRITKIVFGSIRTDMVQEND